MPLNKGTDERLALFESILDSMSESVLVVDRNGKEVYGNRELRRFRGEVAPGQDIDQWRSPALMTIWDMDGRELPPQDWPVARALRGEFKDQFEIRVRGMAHTPEDAILSISTRSLIDADGNIEGAVVVTRDITEVRRTEEILRQSQKLETIGQLTGGIAHDFNNMLAAILSASEVLKRGVEGDAKLTLASNTIEKAALRGAELTRHLLAFARKQALMPEAVNAEALVRETLLLLRPVLDATIEVEVIVAPGPPIFARADAAQLTSALLNLCINARDAMGEAGGKIAISLGLAELAEDFVRLAVTDTGSGMSEATIKRAIEPFFTTKGVGKGSGLGLSMVYGFLRQSGGDLRIESTLGKGTTCAMLLPRATCPSVSAGAGDPRTEPQGKICVLVADDDDLIRDALCLQLNDQGFVAIAAKDGPEALSLAEAGLGFDVLLADMVMPKGMSGVTLAAEVRKLRPNIPAIISTGYVDKEIRSADGAPLLLLRKPYTSAELFAALRDATRRRA